MDFNFFLVYTSRFLAFYFRNNTDHKSQCTLQNYLNSRMYILKRTDHFNLTLTFYLQGRIRGIENAKKVASTASLLYNDE